MKKHISKYGDTGTLLQRKGLKITTVDGQPRARRTHVSPVHTMYERGSLTIAQFSAGKRVYECFASAWGSKSNYEIRERVDGGSRSPEVTTSQIHSMQQLEKAKRHAKQDWNLIEKVCIDEIPPTKRGMGGHERRCILYALRRGLNRVAEVYGYK